MRYRYKIESVGGMFCTLDTDEEIDFDMTAPSIVINNTNTKEKTIVNMKNVVRIIRNEVDL